MTSALEPEQFRQFCHTILVPPHRASVASSHHASCRLPAAAPVLDRPDHYPGELELPPPLGLAVVPMIYCLLAPAKCTISTTSSRRSSLATFPPLSCPPATGTPSTSLEPPPPTSVRCRPAASTPLFLPCDDL
jgi:hypothetical protein